MSSSDSESSSSTSSDSDSDSNSDTQTPPSKRQASEDISRQPKHLKLEEMTSLNRKRSSNNEDSQQRKKSNISKDNREVYCGNLPYSCTEEEVRELFGECGSMERVSVLENKGCAFITFETEEGAKSAIEWNRTEYKGRMLRINMSADKPQPGSISSTGFGPSVIVRNIPFSSDESSIKSFFSNCGNVRRVSIPRYSDTGKMRGFAMVEMENDEQIQNVLKLSGTSMNGREVTIEIAHGKGGGSGGKKPVFGSGGRQSNVNTSFQGKSITFNDSD
ncbi:RNA recognition family protein [Cryptosporidium andersoni]|uniref:RNA recognition family protein n=1 Tax=Cryptosporidium andersoni TaxID=117008 RepID=A0A1J4MUV9_9CRYT|nr:RNA recognition family protein [Cryptosporidium andersoni]